MIKRVLLVFLGVLAVDSVERRTHHRHHHKRPHGISEMVEDIERSFPKYSEKQKQALSKFENPRVFQEVLKASKKRLHERMHEIVRKRRHPTYDDSTPEM